MPYHDIGFNRSKMWGSTLLAILLVTILSVDNVSMEEQTDFEMAHQSSRDGLLDEQIIKRDQAKLRRSNGLTSLLLKNLRFRELERRLLQENQEEDVDRMFDKYERLRSDQEPSAAQLVPVVEKRLTAEDLARVLNSKKPKVDESERLPTLRFAMKKRQSVSVTELAQMLQNKMKARNAPEESVKLQSLRFGRR